MNQRRTYRGGPRDGRHDEEDEREPDEVAAGTGDPGHWPIGVYLPTDERDADGRRIYEWQGGERLE